MQGVNQKMKIELCEDNGFLNDGKPTLVVLVIDGKYRIPYEASKTIQELYVDVKKILDLRSEKKLDDIPPSIFIDKNVWKNLPDSRIRKTLDETIIVEDVTKHPSEIKEILMSDFRKSNEIEREDIVKCVKIHPRDPGADCDLIVGNKYRVININKVNKQVSSYEVIDDESVNKIRIPTLPDEVELFSKRVLKPPSQSKQVFEIIEKCDSCREENVLELNGDRYSGVCEKCGKSLEKQINQTV